MDICFAEYRHGDIAVAFAPLEADGSGYSVTLPDGRVEKLFDIPLFAYEVGERAVVAMNKSDALCLLSYLASAAVREAESKVDEARLYRNNVTKAFLAEKACA